MTDVFGQLQAWYARQCDGEWEHHHGITIETVDNPGWWVRVDLAGTDLEGAPFTDVASNVDDDGIPTSDDWFDCHIEAGEWHGVGDPSKLQQILTVFVEWTASRGNAPGKPRA
jgi:hypothetical protein